MIASALTSAGQWIKHLLDITIFLRPLQVHKCNKHEILERLFAHFSHPSLRLASAKSSLQY
jgi:hypothetical protein